MILVLTAAAGLLVATPARASNPQRCDSRDMLHNADALPSAAPRRLGDLPRANHYLTVFRTVDRCPAPVVVRADIGNSRSER